MKAVKALPQCYDAETGQSVLAVIPSYAEYTYLLETGETVAEAIKEVREGEYLKTPYDIAVDNGFVGSEAEWLESLKGVPGLQGENGKSAYQIAVEKGFEGTEEEWLEKLKGADGKPPELIPANSEEEALVSSIENPNNIYYVVVEQ